MYLLSCNKLHALQPTVDKHAFAYSTHPCIDDHLVNGRVSSGKVIEKDLTTREFTLKMYQLFLLYSFTYLFRASRANTRMAISYLCNNKRQQCIHSLH